jgi:hypothetical protein
VPVEEVEQIEEAEQIEEVEQIEEADDLSAVAPLEVDAPSLAVEAVPLPTRDLQAFPPPTPRPVAPRPGASRQPAPSLARPAQPPRRLEGEDAAIERTATAPQLRRFIKSRAYVPMHELRRRFLINGGDDEVTPVDLERKRVFVGLPEREGRLLGELLRAGDIGYELSLDPISPIVVGVYPMRPVTRV